MTEPLDSKPTPPPKKPPLQQRAIGLIKHKKTQWQALDFAEKLLPLLALLVLFVALFCLVVGYQFGVNHGKQIASVATDHTGKALTVSDVKAMRVENELLKSQITTLTQERDISLGNISLLQAELDARQQQPSATAPIATDNGQPLQVVNMSLTDEGQDTYAYRFDVATNARSQPLTPKLTLLNPTSLVEIPVKTYPTDSGMVVIGGKFVMPKGFHPSQIRLVLNAEGQELVKLYDWQVQ